MKLTEEERKALVTYRLQKAHETLAEAQGIAEMKYWHSSANRLYYACYYAACALLIKNGYSARTHTGVFALFGQHFIKTGLISPIQNKFYRKFFNLRQSGDYDDWFNVEEEDVMQLIEPAKNFIAEIEKLININIEN